MKRARLDTAQIRATFEPRLALGRARRDGDHKLQDWCCDQTRDEWDGLQQATVPFGWPFGHAHSDDGDGDDDDDDERVVDAPNSRAKSTNCKKVRVFASTIGRAWCC